MPEATVQEPKDGPYKSRRNRLPVIHRKIDAMGEGGQKTTKPSRPRASASHRTKPVGSKASKKTAKKPTKKAAKKPAREQVERNGYRLFKSGPRHFFSKHSGRGKGWTKVHQIPDGFKVVRTPNGLPVLKRKAPSGAAKPAKRTAKKSTTAAKRKAQAKSAAKKPAKNTASKDLRPQCAAATPNGKQCRNSAREGSKYCGSHKGFRPTKMSATAKDTKPRVNKAKDTAPAKRKAASTTTKNTRCAAKTAAGKRCSRPSRDRSKYCASHKGYRP